MHEPDHWQPPDAHRRSKALGIGLEKPLGLRTKGRLSEQPERHESVTGPLFVCLVGHPGKLLQAALTATGLLALQAALLDRIGIGLHQLTRPFSLSASLGKADPSE